MNRDARSTRVRTRLGISTLIPLICAVHCLAAPMLVLVSPAFGENPWIEFGALALALGFGIPAVRAGWCEHRSPGPLVVSLAGAAIWSSSLMGLLPLEPVGAVHAVGAVMTGGGLLWNAAVRRRCSCAADREAGVEAEPVSG